jgi:hypothetical protein
MAGITLAMPVLASESGLHRVVGDDASGAWRVAK